MSDMERRALHRAVALLLLVSGLRWMWATRSATLGVASPEVLPELIDASASLVEDGEMRSRPLGEGERLDPNRASERELDRLPGVGPSTARAIVREREERGGFERLDDLARVAGIGASALERLAPHLDFGDVPSPGARTRGAPPRTALPLVDLNRADADALESLPGIGPALAARIVDERRNGRFRALEDLVRVPGIGPATVDRLRGRVSFDGRPG